MTRRWLPASRALALALLGGVVAAAHAVDVAVAAAVDVAGESAGRAPRDTVILPRAARARPSPPSFGKRTAAGEAGAATRCAACHLVDGWEKVRFNHDPTGFPLRGAHVDVTCSGCHRAGFDTPVANTCSGCHRDRHASEFGLHCEGCHDDQSWRPLFNADAHRNTNFPLVGRHAMIPCTECHGNQRDRTFTQTAVRCDACHEADFLRTGATSIDHAANAFSRECQQCHSTFRFFPASMRAHDSCFRISGGSHHGVRCLGCHTALAGVTFNGSCATGTFNCSGCHDHACARSELQHKTVMGYECANAKCYECHKLGGL